MRGDLVQQTKHYDPTIDAPARPKGPRHYDAFVPDEISSLDVHPDPNWADSPLDLSPTRPAIASWAICQPLEISAIAANGVEIPGRSTPSGFEDDA